eukprot:5573282-Pleurochrysis_carterae.AAC.10
MNTKRLRLYSRHTIPDSAVQMNASQDGYASAAFSPLTGRRATTGRQLAETCLVNRCYIHRTSSASRVLLFMRIEQVFGSRPKRGRHDTAWLGIVRAVLLLERTSRGKRAKNITDIYTSKT